MQSSDLLHTFLSVSLGGVAYRRRSGVILFLQHSGAMPVPFLMTGPYFFLLPENKKEPDITELLLQNIRLKIYLIIFRKQRKKAVPFFKILPGFKKGTAQIAVYIVYLLPTFGNICLHYYDIYETE